jgi:hypothetical protein
MDRNPTRRFGEKKDMSMGNTVQAEESRNSHTYACGMAVIAAPNQHCSIFGKYIKLNR